MGEDDAVDAPVAMGMSAQSFLQFQAQRGELFTNLGERRHAEVLAFEKFVAGMLEQVADRLDV